MVNAAVLGYGVVGSGVAHVLERNAALIERKAGQPVKLKRVLDLREFPGSTIEPLLTRDFVDILNDPEIRVVAEAMGGLEPAYTYVKQALQAGKHVCTSNKELVAEYGAELLAVAQANNVSFLFEASVGGGIPVVRPLSQTLTTDEVTSVSGILNGTSNYILTHMSAFDKDFGESLAEAQAKGFAEKDPSADVDGHDTCRKLAILLSLASGKNVDYKNIRTIGISNITREDLDFAKMLGHTVKLIGCGNITLDGVGALIAPMLIHHVLPFYSVQDVYNCVSVRAAMTDDVLFYGRGAGSLPTAAAVVSDMVDAVKNDRHIGHNWSPEPAEMLPFGEYYSKKLVRMKYEDRVTAIRMIEDAFGDAVFLYEHNNYPGRLAFFTPGETEDEAAEKLKWFGSVSVIRVYNG